MLTATVFVDLTDDAEPDSMRHRVACLPDVPSGARVVVRVGALTIEPEVVRVLALHQRRLLLDVQGTPFAVRRWLEAVRTNMGEVLI
jgi:hypothetical protein